MPGVGLADIFEVAGVQMRMVLAFSVRDAPKRIFVCTVICGVLGIYAGHVSAVQAASLILFYEATSVYLHRTLPTEDVVIGRAHTALVIFLFASSTIGYGLPGILLMQQPSQAAQIIGLLWMTGIGLHAIGAHTTIVMLSWATVLPICLCVMVGLWTLHPDPPLPITDIEKYLLVVMWLVWAGNAVEVTMAQAANRAAFGQARYDAEIRLQKLDHLARHDALTGLLNRRAFDEVLSDALMMPDENAGVAVMLFDLDGFKAINDRHGHAAGDAVLVAFAKRLEQHLGQDCVARLGGDEFIATLAAHDLNGLVDWANTLEDDLTTPITFESMFLQVGVSIGVAIAQPHETASALCSRADDAMYAAKLTKGTSRRERYL